MKFCDIWKYGKSVTTYFAASVIPMLLMVLANPLIALNMRFQDIIILFQH